MSPPAPDSPGAFARRVLIVLSLAAVALALWRLRIIVLMVFIAILLAVFLRLLADPIARRTGLPGPIAVLLALALLIASLMGLGALIGGELQEQLRDLALRIPAVLRQLTGLLRDAGLPIDAQGLLDSGSIEAVALQAAGAAQTLLQITAQTIVVLFGALFLALQPRLYVDGLLALFPPGQRAKAEEYLLLTGGALKQWLLGQLTSMLIIGVLVSVALMVIGLPGALALGVLTAVAEFVPYVGAISAGLVATLVALSVSPETALITFLAYLVVQQLEGNLITPLVMRRAVRLAPALNVFALASLAAVFGPAGVFVAVPFAVTATVAVKFFWLRLALNEETNIPGQPVGRRRAGARNAQRQ